MAALADEVRERYALSLSTDYVERCMQSKTSLTSMELYQKSLRENLRDICGTSLLPYGICTQVSTTLPNSVVMQINASRDATQPLRSCADVSEEEAVLNAPSQRNWGKRLLRLQLTDGNIEIPALELCTLHAFKGIPIPGEKVLIHKDAEVRNGCIIMSENNVCLLGGEVHQLKQDFLVHRRRLESGYQTINGLDGAPRFTPLGGGQHYLSNVADSGAAFDMEYGGETAAPSANERGRGRGNDFHSDAGSGYTNHVSSSYGVCGRGGDYSRGGRERRGGGGSYGRDSGRSRGRGSGGCGGRGVCVGVNKRGRVGGAAYHADAANVQSLVEKFPEISEANFPRLV